MCLEQFEKSFFKNKFRFLLKKRLRSAEAELVKQHAIGFRLNESAPDLFFIKQDKNPVC